MALFSGSKVMPQFLNPKMVKADVQKEMHTLYKEYKSWKRLAL